MDADDFIRRWSEAPISERAHYQTFIGQLCRLIGVAAPDDERTGDLDYCFERPVKFLHEDGGSHPGTGYGDSLPRPCEPCGPGSYTCYSAAPSSATASAAGSGGTAASALPVRASISAVVRPVAVRRRWLW